MRYIADHQEAASGYTEPNWVNDEYFGTTIQCGSESTLQKDIISLPDVDYGSTGAWSMSVWFRHADVNFANYEREQFMGHGDPAQATTSVNQFHVQLETSRNIRTILRDSTHSGSSGGTTDTDGSVIDTTDGLWHHYLVTQRPDGSPGYNVYIDGELRAADPYVSNVGINPGITSQVMGTRPINPEGHIRLCGRELFGAGVYHEDRYFLGRVAHFAVWNSNMSPAQVTEMYNAYATQYNFPATPAERAAWLAAREAARSSASSPCGGTGSLCNFTADGMVTQWASSAHSSSNDDRNAPRYSGRIVGPQNNINQCGAIHDESWEANTDDSLREIIAVFEYPVFPAYLEVWENRQPMILKVEYGDSSARLSAVTVTFVNSAAGRRERSGWHTVYDGDTSLTNTCPSVARFDFTAPYPITMVKIKVGTSNTGLDAVRLTGTWPPAPPTTPPPTPPMAPSSGSSLILILVIVVGVGVVATVAVCLLKKTKTTPAFRSGSSPAEGGAQMTDSASVGSNADRSV